MKFEPGKQIAYTQDAERCFFGTAPTLTELNLAYELSTASTWITAQICDLSEYCGCKDKLTGRPLEQCAELIAERYHWLKVTELMLFFKRFKCGEYGRFYGSVDPMVIMEALRTFVNCDRSNAIDRQEARNREQERERWEQEKGDPATLQERINRLFHNNN